MVDDDSLTLPTNDASDNTSEFKEGELSPEKTSAQLVSEIGLLTAGEGMFMNTFGLDLLTFDPQVLKEIHTIMTTAISLFESPTTEELYEPATSQVAQELSTIYIDGYKTSRKIQSELPQALIEHSQFFGHSAVVALAMTM